MINKQPQLQQQVNQPTNEKVTTQMSEEEESVYKGFERMQEVYNSAYVNMLINSQTDENKQKQFGNMINILHGKLRNKEVKINLLRLLTEFLNCNYKKNNKNNKFQYMNLDLKLQL